MQNGTKLFFPGEGARPENKLQGDLNITLKQAEHEVYRREGNNLIYRHKISLLNALQTAPFEFKTLDGELFCITPDEIVSPSTLKVFKGKGMPILNDDPLSPLIANKVRGDFILKFEVIFPTDLQAHSKDDLCAVLDEVAEEE